VTLTNHERFTLVERLARTATPVRATLRPVEQQFFGEIVFLLKTLFFLYLGISIRFVDLRMVGAAVLLVIVVYLARLLVTRRVADREMSVRDATVASIMVPKGLAAAVLATVPLRYGLPGGELIRDLTFAVVFFSITLTALMGWAAERAPLQQVYERIFAPFAAAPVPAARGRG
jgi:cell volume regulation protein A